MVRCDECPGGCICEWTQVVETPSRTSVTGGVPRSVECAREIQSQVLVYILTTDAPSRRYTAYNEPRVGVCGGVTDTDIHKRVEIHTTIGWVVPH